MNYTGTRHHGTDVPVEAIPDAVEHDPLVALALQPREAIAQGLVGALRNLVQTEGDG